METNNIVNKITTIFLVISLMVVMSSCSATKQCEYENFLEYFTSIDGNDENSKITAFVYDESKSFTSSSSGNEIEELFPKRMEKSDSINKSDKILSITVDTQYEITFFENGGIMIYYGYCGVFQKDRQYYIYEEGYDVSGLIDYITENYTLLESGD